MPLPARAAPTPVSARTTWRSSSAAFVSTSTAPTSARPPAASSPARPSPISASSVQRSKPARRPAAPVAMSARGTPPPPALPPLRRSLPPLRRGMRGLTGDDRLSSGEPVAKLLTPRPRSRARSNAADVQVAAVTDEIRRSKIRTSVSHSRLASSHWISCRTERLRSRSRLKLPTSALARSRTTPTNPSRDRPSSREANPSHSSRLLGGVWRSPNSQSERGGTPGSG